MTDELKVVLQTIWEELSQEHINKVVANFTKRLRTSAVTLSFSSSHLITNKPTLFRATHRLPAKKTLRAL